MDQIKIGQYIADKRKAQSMTQEQLAEKLGKSRKAVSKWERGVCLPDVSVYTELCDILGITLNEFFAGEDIEPIDVPERSEKNLLGVAIEGENKSGRFKKIAIAIAAVTLILAAALGFVIKKEGYFLSNYLKSVDGGTKEGQKEDIETESFIDNIVNEADNAKDTDERLRKYFSERGGTVKIISHEGLEL